MFIRKLCSLPLSMAAAKAGVKRVKLWVDNTLTITTTNPNLSLTVMAAAQVWRTQVLGSASAAKSARGGDEH